MLRLQRRLVRVLSARSRQYTSYPDPNEKPRISQHITSKSLDAVAKQILDKSGSGFSLDSKFRMDELFPGVPVSTGILEEAPPTTLSSKLGNGLVVATQEMHGLMSSFAFVMAVGSSSEKQTGVAESLTTGVTQILELTAFGNTENRSQQQFSAEMEQLGGMVQCISSREQIMFCVDVLRENIEPALKLLADTVLTPRLAEDDITEAREVIALQANELPAEQLSRDAATVAAFAGSPLGNTHFCPPEAAARITRRGVQEFRTRHLLGSNSLVSAAGVEHTSFVQLVERHFSALPAGTSEIPGEPVYSGGMVKNERPLQEPFVKVALAFPVGGWKDDRLVPCCVLQQLMGGGSSFSAGGPGKGMYTRLYREMLNQHHWVESAEAFMVVHNEAGLLGIDGACAPEFVKDLIREILFQLCRLGVEPVSDVELSRAKNMLKSMMLMQLESRLILCEDIARQVAIYGKRAPPEDICAKIDAVTQDDILKLAADMLKSRVSVGCAGHDLSHIPAYADIDAFVRQMKVALEQNIQPKGGGGQR